ncbi:MAG: pyridoxamine 5'-phosphate oxidase [Chloroflexota bacterium]
MPDYPLPSDPGTGPTMLSLDLSDLDPDPIRQFDSWHAAATAAGMREPNAMTLATADTSGTPSARIVLLRGVDERGFTWHSNRTSPKGQDLAENPKGALVFHWDILARQVRTVGPVVQLSEGESAVYFAGRSRMSQLSAWASDQSRPLASRHELEDAIARLDREYPGEVPLPPFWGGYRLRPLMIEFWQGRCDRMHDRFAYQRERESWRIERLAP